MMSHDILQEFQVVGTAFFSGAVITIVYDLIRIFRRVIAHGNIWINIEDFIFWIWTSLWIFSVLYRENDGNFRLYTILAMVLGMLLYHKTISEPFVRYVGMVLKKLVFLVFYPLKLLKFYIIFFGNKLKKNIQSIIMIINNHNR